MNVWTEYEKKLRTPEDAVSIVKSGDWVDYSMGPNFPELLDKALAARKTELKDVKIRGGLTIYPYIAVVEEDKQRESFIFNSWHFSAYERKLHDMNLCNYIPMTFRYLPNYYRKGLIHSNVAFVCGSKMDEKGNFSVGISNTCSKALVENASFVVLEENENYPRVCGDGHYNVINVSEVDMVVIGKHRDLPILSCKEPSIEDVKIAGHILSKIENGSILQLGIGGLPDVVGSMIAESDLKDLGCHSEMIGDAFVKLHEAGKLTNTTKKVHKGKSVWTLALGTEKTYKWLDNNEEAWTYPVDYVNYLENIAVNDKLVSINSALEADLYGQTCSETVGTRNISGAGGQLDFLTGAFFSEGGKGILCMTSTYISKDGEVKSRIVPTMSPGNVVTDPRSQAFYFATEFGIVNLAGLSTWERAEKMISIAHPDFRDELIAAAETQKIWVRSNRM